MLAAGCSPGPSQTTTAEASPAESPCPDDGPRFERTGFCQGRAANHFDPARLTSTPGELPEGCAWAINETVTPDPDEAILYKAMSCNGRTTHLEFSAGAHSASLGWGVSGFFDTVPTGGEEGAERVRLFRLDGVADPRAMILDIARGAAAEENVPAAEVAACEIRPAGEGYPPDAYVVDAAVRTPSAAAPAPPPGETEGPGEVEPAVCGSWGADDSRSYWMIRDGYAWFVREGQDLPDFDGSSLTVFRRGADGWMPAG